jgi:hypothetical protein
MAIAKMAHLGFGQRRARSGRVPWSRVRGDDVVGEAGLAGSEGGPVAGELEDSNGGVWHLNDRNTTQ